MNVSLYQAAAALNATGRWQELISENLSASSVPGYKKQEISFAAIQAGLMPTGGRSMLPVASTATNFRQGELKFTGANTDLALEGPGFLTVQMPDGTIAYTRDGELRVNPAGQLVTKQGFLLLADSGPIQLDLNNRSPVSVSPTGEVSQGTDLKGRIQIVDFAEPNALMPITQGYFRTNDSTSANPALNTWLRQGFLEAANTSAATEMAHLITAMRLFEANQRVIQLQDERMAQAIAELGNPS